MESSVAEKRRERQASFRDAYGPSCSMLFCRVTVSKCLSQNTQKQYADITREKINFHTFRVNASRLIVSLALELLQQCPKPLRILRVLQSNDIRLVLEVVKAVQLRTSRAATQDLRRVWIRRLSRVRIRMHALGCAQRLGNAWGSRGHGGGYCDIVRNGLSGGRRRRSGNRWFAITVIPELGSLQQGLACG